MKNNSRLQAHIPLDKGRHISKEFYDNPLTRVYFYRVDWQPVLRSKPNWETVKGAYKIVTFNIDAPPWEKVDIIRFDNNANLIYATLKYPELGTPDTKDLAWDYLNVDIGKMIQDDVASYEQLLEYAREHLKMWQKEPERVLKNLDNWLVRDKHGNQKIRYLLKNLKVPSSKAPSAGLAPSTALNPPNNHARKNFGPMTANSILAQIRARQNNYNQKISRLAPRKQNRKKIG